MRRFWHLLVAEFRGLVHDEAFTLMRSLPYSPTAG